ncbi:hypothetical protein [Arthrobacter psychrolactophilus]|uniref:hypothetical protein n=1 Tax=Arthrobacter psychrolactophilus TaxID=92442 RepID=UPI0011B4870E|nr:hypothetical protein [Arthrobacter psychrolactophilus]
MEINKSQEFARRNIVKSVVWTTPVIVAAVAAPTASASILPTNYTLSVSSINVAPAVPTQIDGQSVLGTNQTFNTFVSFFNSGPDAAPSVSGQVTFDQGSIPGESPGEFTVNAPWVITGISVNTDLNRWIVEVTYSGSVAAGALAPALIVTARTRLAVAHPVGDSGPYIVLARALDANGGSADTQQDYYYVRR